MRTPLEISAFEERALELFGELECGGVLISVFCDDDNMLLVFVDKSRTSGANPTDQYLRWLNKEVIKIEFLLVIDDVITHPLSQRSQSKMRYSFGSYLGAPIKDKGGHTAGSIGAFNRTAHRWSENEIQRIRIMAKEILTE